MKLLLSLAGLLLLAAAVAGLQCYVCDNCESNYENKNQTCVPEYPQTPATASPATAPPATAPPATAPPATAPPATVPLTTGPPATALPVTAPPAPAPLATAPPATAPPATNPPATAPSASNPSAPAPLDEENQEKQEGIVAKKTPEVVLSDTKLGFVREVRANETFARCVQSMTEHEDTELMFYNYLRFIICFLNVVYILLIHIYYK